MMRTFEEWKSWYEAHAEPANPIEGALLYFEPAHGFFFRRAREMAEHNGTCYKDMGRTNAVQLRRCGFVQREQLQMCL